MYEIKTTIQKSRHFAYEGIHSVGIKIGCHLRIVAFALVENVNSCHIFVRFGFDDRRTSQTLRIVKNKAAGTLHRVYYMPTLLALLRSHTEIQPKKGQYILHQRGAFRCSFRQSGQCEGLSIVERVTEQALRFFVCIQMVQ